MSTTTAEPETTSVERPPAPRAASRLVAFATIVAVGTAIAFGGEPGIGYIITRVVAFAGLLTIGIRQAARPGEPGERRRTLRIWGLSIVSLSITAIGSQRAAGWVFAICLLGSLMTGSLALAGGSTFTGLVRGSVATWIAGIRRWPWLVRGLRELWRTTTGSLGKVASAFGILIFAGLCAWLLLLNPRQFLMPLAVVGSLTLGGYYVLATRPSMDPPWNPVRRLATTVWAPIVALIDAGLIGYTVLFRGGMLRLLVLAGIATVVIAMVRTFAPSGTPGQRALQRILLGVLAATVLAYAILAWLHLYGEIGTAGLTRDRFLAFCGVAVIAAAFVLVIVAGIGMGGSWLPKSIYGLATAVLIALAAINPDAIIAQVNVDRGIRADYLPQLSADAIDVLDRLPDPQRSCTLRPIAEELAKPEHWYDYNRARAHARAVLAAHPLDPTPTC